ncbi:T9SS type A sorting domain-containing protein [Tenacibaculum sp. S7007]|uniref:T9SS type A sorting domain-containing protein n=1 Tax=Tenacibaculum pelagium TaxID=2759527 RepID=A0A839AL16_9FLAO|nr:GEVED domain-containing protein [Tenacibaculum pelagium]MBA6155832.1 T9SS type A sorting domain-containing protein [Tenacibaculum pelagium]
MIKKQALLVFIISFFSISNLCSQHLWKKTEKQNFLFKQSEILHIKNFPKKYSLVDLELSSLKNHLQRSNSSIIELPNSDGKLQKFQIKETSNLAPELAAKFPSIKSYTAQGIDDPAAVAKISTGTDGFHAVIFSGNKGTVYIDPYSKDRKKYIVYNRKNLEEKEDEFTCGVKEIAQKRFLSNNQQRNVSDGKLRTYRIAIVCSGEYANFHLNRQGISASASEADKKTAVLSAMNSSMTRINGVYEKDLGVKMVIVANNDKVIFLNKDTDNITDGDAGTMIDEVQTICDNQIGVANYDIGHIFSIGGSGLAGLGVVCVEGQKAKGVTGISSPIGDPYDIDYVAHEIGHQFGANHTQNNDCNRNGGTAVEPGSASTIMGYAGICSPNVQNNSHDNFHAVSIAEMWNHMQNAGNCAVKTDIGNTAPTANAGSDVSIPKSTPFVLKGQATDAQGLASLTYNWEQIDPEIASMPPTSTNTAGPMFRALPSKTTPNRYMPALATVIGGSTSSTWEVVPSVSRTMNFAFTVRDNHAGGGNTARDDIKVTVTNADPFTVTAPNTSVSWGSGSTQTITWNKGTTDQDPINCTKVNIKLSIDGGLTFPILIKENTANDGTEEITIPNNPSANARIMVEAADNIFYNINNSNFTIFPATPDFNITNNTGNLSICNKAVNQQVFKIDYKALFGFNENTTLAVSGAPTGSSPTLSQSSISTNDIVDLTLSNLNNVSIGDYTIKVTATSASVSKSIDILFNVNDNLCNSSGNTSSQISTTLVNFGNINNTSTKTNGYSDFKSISSEVIKGDKYLLKANVNTDGNNSTKTYAWIDWNQNCLFDANEKYDLGEAANTSGATNNSGLEVTIPNDALIGSTILRVTTKLASDGDPNSCELNFNGEVEDYTITITPSFTLTNKTGSLSICNKAVSEVEYMLDFSVFNDFNEDVALSITDAPANATTELSINSINTSNVFTLTVSNLSNVAVSDYTIKVTGASTSMTKSVDLILSVNDNHCKSSGNLDSQISITNVKFGEIDNSSTKTNGYSDFKSISTGVVRGESYDLSVTINKDGNDDVKTHGWIDWNENCLFDDNEGFDLTSNNFDIVIPEDAILGNKTLRISTKLKTAPNSCELDFDGEVEDYTINVEESFATDATLFDDLKIYPVPSDGNITVNFKVKVKDLTIVRLFDLRGQLLDTQSFSTVSSSFNKEIQFKRPSGGIYLLQVENDGKIETRKVIFR